MQTADSSTPASTKAVSDKVPMSQKFGYGLGSLIDMWGHWLYPTLSFQVFNIFLGVAPGLVSTALMINRFFDAGSDPFFGWLSDNTRSRFGRRRPYILIGAILAGIGLPLLYMVTPGWGETVIHVNLGFWKDTLHISYYFWYMIASSAIYIPVMSCFNMPWVSLGSEMTPDYHERTSVMSIKNAIQKVPELAMFFALQFTTLSIFDDASGKPNILRGAQVYCVILGILMIFAGIGVFSLVRERYYHQVVSRKQERISIKETLYKTVKCKPFRKVLVMVLAYGIGTSMVAALGYYNTVYYVCKGDIALATKWNTAMGIAGMVFGFSGLPFFTFLARRFGKRHAMITVFVMAIGAFIGDWWFYNPNLPILQILACGFVAFTGAGFWMLYGSILADVIDYDELDTGKRREGSFSSCQSWISKVGMAAGAGASGWILQFTGFDSKLAAQAPQTILMIRVMLSAIPVIGLLFALWAIIRFPLTHDKMDEIRLELEARRGTV
ncbi:putative symporter YjmB [mine drainage metagenome]|uniref:Putative symporter YjmB n=1 Tax=mine drainage metagenome TaxID=410659 RepID=A0A1J5SZ75_9ZZZZ